MEGKLQCLGGLGRKLSLLLLRILLYCLLLLRNVGERLSGRGGSVEWDCGGGAGSEDRADEGTVSVDAHEACDKEEDGAETKGIHEWVLSEDVDVYEGDEEKDDDYGEDEDEFNNITFQTYQPNFRY